MVDADAFRHVMGGFATGVTVVTLPDDPPHGITVNILTPEQRHLAEHFRARMMPTNSMQPSTIARKGFQSTVQVVRS